MRDDVRLALACSCGSTHKVGPAIDTASGELTVRCWFCAIEGKAWWRR